MRDAVELLTFLGGATGAACASFPQAHLGQPRAAPQGQPWSKVPEPFIKALAGAGPAISGGRGHRNQAQAPSTCSHCGSQQTPRWWRDISPDGMLCNACGIWLKRHGTSRPVQYFADGGSPAAAAALLSPGASGLAPRSTPPTGRGAQHSEDAGEGPPAQIRPPSPRRPGQDMGGFYLINGRPKRRRSGGQPGAAISSCQDAERSGDEDRASVDTGRADPAQAQPPPAPCTPLPPLSLFQDAGAAVFVLQRRVLRGVDGARTGALVRIGWAPGSRSAHTLFQEVCRVAEACLVEDFELLSDCAASLHLTPLLPGSAVTDDDVLGLIGKL
uniref:GATA-type domain-containing protein n=1 Tax=Auxenochlorella protothecoides TaxID=3075 RepID=A0A1D1ZV47_AUXPR